MNLINSLLSTLLSYLEIVKLYPTPNRSFKNSEDPQQISLPLPIIPILSPRKSASSIKCVVNITIRLFLYYFSISQMYLLAEVSIPLVGSSRKTILLLPMKAIATLSFRFYPPERFLLYTSALSFKPTSPINFSTSLLMSVLSDIPLYLANSSRCSLTVSTSKRTLC